MSTLLAVMSTNFPIKHGNNFTLKMHDGKSTWVKNMSAEDFKEICKRINLTTVEVLYLPDNDECYIIDSRIPRGWLLDYVSEHDREYTFSAQEGDDYTVTYRLDRAPEKRIMDYTARTDHDTGYFYAPYELCIKTLQMLNENTANTTQYDVPSEDKDD